MFLIILLNQQNEEPESTLTSARSLRSTNIDVSQIPEFKGDTMNIMNAEMYRFKSDEADGEITNSTIEVVKNIQDVSFETGYLKQYMQDSVYRGNEYEYDNVTSKENTFNFNQLINGKPVFNHHNARVRFLKQEGNKLMEQAYLVNVKESNFSTPQKVRDPLQIVEELYKEKAITTDAKILDAKLGYYIIVVEEESRQVVMRPKWQLVIEEENLTRTIYIDAISQTEKIIEKE
ncbi:two-component system regulatory protein YycI [Phocicoccus pinnipedialis]